MFDLALDEVVSFTHCDQSTAANLNALKDSQFIVVVVGGTSEAMHLPLQRINFSDNSRDVIESQVVRLRMLYPDGTLEA